MRLRTFCVLAVAVAGMATHCEAGIIYTAPPSLAPGSPYRLAFVTDGTYEAISSNIGDYNNDVAAEAALSALSALGTTWKVIGSTASVSAISNIGSDPGVPIYDLHGNLVADDATTSPGGLFAGEPLLSPIAFTPTGASLSSIAVSTGTHPDGTPHATAELGSSYSIVIYGMITTWAGGWTTVRTGPNERIADAPNTTHHPPLPAPNVLLNGSPDILQRGVLLIKPSYPFLKCFPC